MRWAVALKLTLGFAALVAATGLLGVLAVRALDRASAITSTIASQDAAALDTLGELRASLGELRSARHRALEQVLADPAAAGGEATEAPAREWRSALADAQRQVAALTALSTDARQEALSSTRRAGWVRLEAALAEVALGLGRLAEQGTLELDRLAKGAVAGALERSATSRQLAIELDQSIRDCYGVARELVTIGQQLGHDTTDDAQRSILLACAIATLAGILLAWGIQRSIVRPLASLVTVVEGVGRGDLTRHATPPADQDLARLATSVNSMVEGLREITGQLRAATLDLNASSTQIVAAAKEQVAGATEQATAVQETTATVNEIAQAGSQIAERSRQIAASSSATLESSRAGTRAVGEAIEASAAVREQTEVVASTIVALSERTQAVGDIIASVREIAEQSHLLALNAAIEAAAAGEHGRSFAVVAAELKTLADEAKSATIQVRSILGEIQKGINSSVLLTEETVKRVETGHQRALVAEQALGEMAASLEQSVHTFQQIVAAVNQQQVGVEQVHLALRDVSTAARQGADGTRQVELAAASLDALAKQLRQTLERYRI